MPANDLSSGSSAGPTVGIVTDSSSDLPEEAVAELGISVVPLTIRFGSKEFVDRVELSPKEFWARCASSPELPETAAPSPGAFEQAYRALAAKGAPGIVCITLSSALSATHQAASTAAAAVAEDVPVRVVDSRSITMGLGLLALSAARLAAEGASLDEVATAVSEKVPRIRVYGALATLEYLRRGGRIGPAAAVFGSLLSVKPIIEVRNGVVEGESRQRTRGRSLRYLAEKVREHRGPVAVVHGDAEDLDEFLELLSPLVAGDELVVSHLGPVIGTHAGPGAIGVVFEAAGP
jgi:DegV family protein with EDD domain